MATPKEKRLEVMKFLEKGQILIADKVSSSRVRLAKALNVMGAKSNLTQMHTGVTTARDALKTTRPMLIISDYYIEGGSAFDLFKEARATSLDPKNVITIIVTANTSQSVVASAAEEDVDAFILKPYTPGGFEETVINTIYARLFPGAYIEKIEEGKTFLFDGKFAESLVCFEAAVKLHKTPTLALFYLAQAKLLTQDEGEAQEKYDKGLQLNHIHYKCLVGLYELYQKQDKFREAYQVVRKVAKFFPSNPDRLLEVIRLAVRTASYEDMEGYYTIFTGLEVRHDIVVRGISAGMYVCGKHFMSQDNKEKAMLLFEKVGIACEGRPHFLRAIIEVLSDKDYFTETEKFLGRFRPEDRDSADFYVADFLSKGAKLKPEEKIQKGLELINKKNHSFQVYCTVIKNMYTTNKEGQAKDLVVKASERWPEYVHKLPAPLKKEGAA